VGKKHARMGKKSSTGQWFSPGTQVSSINKTEILLKTTQISDHSSLICATLQRPVISVLVSCLRQIFKHQVALNQ
jgi:hypothetical protein